MRHLKLTIAYDGTDYVGWQVQPNGVTIQQRLEEAWQKLTGERRRITASGRTDSGVHASGQVCSLETQSEASCFRLMRGVNAHLPDDIAVLKIQNAPTGFHAIADATEKTYRYKIQYGKVCNPLTRNTAWYCPYRFDIEPMIQAAQNLVGEHDFASFQATGSDRESTVRNLTQLDCHATAAHGSQYIDIETTCNGFLYNMVRNIVGTLADVGRGRKKPDWVAAVLSQRDRKIAGQTAPAHGLSLVNVEYSGVEFSGDESEAESS